MRKRTVAFLLACLLAASVTAAFAKGRGITWTEEERAKLRIGNPTALQGRFFTAMWGGTTSDLDVQDLLHAYSPVCYDIDLTRFRFDHSVLQDAIVTDDEEGNRTYLMVFYDDLLWSDGTPITAADYAFTFLFSMDPAIAETGGKPADCSWIVGAEDYLEKKSRGLRGLRVITDRILEVQVKAEALPYFYELSRFMIHPYPISVIAPGLAVRDDGEGAYLSGPLTAEMITRTVLDPETGYLSHPSVVSGAYTLTEFEGTKARFTINEYFKGTEEGIVPRIGELEYDLADNNDLIDLLEEGEYGLLNKVTLSENIRKGIENLNSDRIGFSSENYARTGLTLLWFPESSRIMQETDVRRAAAYCFDRKGFVQEYVGMYGLLMDGFYGLGQWMYRLAGGFMAPPVDPKMPEAERTAAEDAYRSLSLDGLTKYALNQAEADRLLKAAGWQPDGEGGRKKTAGGETEELEVVLGFPKFEETTNALVKYFVHNLEEAGFRVTLRPMEMDEIARVYRGEEETADILYLGENFSIIFDPEVLAPEKGMDDPGAHGGLTEAKAELYRMAQEMVRTDPDDLLGFIRKWIALQEAITEKLPLLPVYSNVYFDFFFRELHNYRITHAVTWAETVIRSFISDTEELTEEEKQRQKENAAEIDGLQEFGAEEPEETAETEESDPDE